MNVEIPIQTKSVDICLDDLTGGSSFESFPSKEKIKKQAKLRRGSKFTHESTLTVDQQLGWYF